jgi:signal transduction histidine kinase
MIKKVNLLTKSMFLLAILTSLMLIPHYTQAAKDNDVEHLKKELRQASGQEKLNLLKDIVGYYREVSFEETNQYLEQYLALAEANNSRIDKAQAHSFYSSIAFNQLEYSQVISHSKQALAIYEELGDSLNICHQYATMARAFVSLRQSDSALQTIKVALNYYRQHGHHLFFLAAKIQFGKAYHISDQYIQAREIFQEVATEAYKQKHHRYEAWVLYWLGTTNVRLGNFQEAIANFEGGIRANDLTGNVTGKLGTMQELGDMFLIIGEFANAYQLYFDCYQQKDVVKGYQGELQFTAEYLINLGKIYHNTQRYQKALKHYDSAMRLIEQFDFSPTRGIIHNLTGQTYLNMGNPTKALHHFEQSYSFYQELSSIYAIAKTQNHIAEVYMSLGEYDTAISYLEMANRANIEIHNKYGEAMNRKNLAVCYYHQEKYKMAMNELDAGMPYVLESALDNLLLDYYSTYILLYNQAANHQKAQSYFEKFLSLSGEITSRHTINLTDLLLRSHTNELNTRMAFLQQTIEMQKMESNQNALQFQRLLLFTMVIILVLVLIGILYYFKLKTSKKLQHLVEERTHTIRQHEQKLMEMSKAKDRMYSIIAHDLKSPFNTLLGFSGILRDEYDDSSDAEKKEYIGYIHNSSERLFALLENLLEWTRSSSGNISCKPVQNDLNLIIQNTIQLQQRNAAEKHIALNNRVPKNTFVFADENMLHTIVRNLTSNAIKFTNPGGSINFSATNGNAVVKCTVEDTGTGIAPEDIDKLFDTDSEVRKNGTANESGSGLGLVLVKEFVEKNNGKLSVESQLEVGSAFSFELPAK